MCENEALALRQSKKGLG